MSGYYYKEAHKLALKAEKSAAHLPVLDEIVTSRQIVSGKSLGLEHIPLEFVIGTRTAAREEAFAANFMPLLPENSEFAGKWMSLCSAHLQEGIRDPIKVYEYMNRFYVEEGNKRVSVLKYFDAVNVDAYVTRIMPENDGSERYKIYMAFLQFYEESGLRTIELSRPEGYAKIQKLLGKSPGEKWNDYERRSFDTLFYYFRRDYEELGGDDLRTAAGDAFLAYISVYGVHDLWVRTPREIADSVEKVWEEITLQDEDDAIEVKASPSEKHGNIITRMMPKSSHRLMVGFVHDKDPETYGWTYSHERGRQRMQRILGDSVETKSYFHAMDKGPEQTIEQAVNDGCEVIFTTSTRLFPASLRVAVEHPDVTIMNCSLNKSHRYVRTYYARMYEVKFIVGAIAGALCGSDSVGYICNYPIYGQFSSINAFALGVQLTNPGAKVYLEWSSVGGIDAAIKRLTDRGIKLISVQDNPTSYTREQGMLGLMSFDGDKRTVLAKPIWRWGVYYETFLRQFRDKTLKEDYEKSRRAQNYYFGLSSGVVGLEYGETLPWGVKKLADFMTDGIIRDILRPFRGPIHTQDGVRIASAWEPLDFHQILNMDWLNENIIGTVPSYEEMDDTAKASVETSGLPGIMRRR